MEELTRELTQILDEQEKLLDALSEKQLVLRQTVTQKNWESLIAVISEINMLSDSFQHFDLRRDELQNQLKMDELKPYFPQLGKLRSKLLKCKAENKALGEYVNATCSFINGIVEKALPQSRNKVYSKKGIVVQPQPQSVVVNMSF